MEVSGATSILQSSLQTTPQQVQRQPVDSGGAAPAPAAVVPPPLTKAVDSLAAEAEPVEEPVPVEPGALGAQVDVFA